MALRAESAHEKGRKGVLQTKRWLESTTHLELAFDAYDWAPECTISCLDGSQQTFDLKGHLYKEKAPVFVENKAVDGVRDKPNQYADFLAIAYSATAAEIRRVQDPKWQFMWVTTHPFNQTDWTKLTKRKRIVQALEADRRAASADENRSDLLNGEEIDDDVLDLLVGRIWLLVLNKRQSELTLTPKELSKIEALLNRKGRI